MLAKHDLSIFRHSAFGGISPSSSQPSQVSGQASTHTSIWPLIGVGSQACSWLLLAAFPYLDNKSLFYANYSISLRSAGEAYTLQSLPLFFFFPSLDPNKATQVFLTTRGNRLHKKFTRMNLILCISYSAILTHSAEFKGKIRHPRDSCRSGGHGQRHRAGSQS